MRTYQNNSARDNCVATAILCAVLAAVAVGCSGCGTLTGIREADLWGAKFTFAEGIDIHAGANSVDRVDNRRGIAPIRGQQKGAVPAAYDKSAPPTAYDRY